jgi:hypothetical protein
MIAVADRGLFGARSLSQPIALRHFCRITVAYAPAGLRRVAAGRVCFRLLPARA